MFEKEIILEEQLAVRRLFQCSPARKLLASAPEELNVASTVFLGVS
jgi:hypothetical protein